MKKSIISLAVFLWFYSTLLVAEIFVWQDQYGQKHYSDKPRAAAKTLSIDPGYAWHKIQYVYDGDTIKLENGQKVRLSGINTPEVENRHHNGEPLGEKARQWLLTKLNGETIRLETDLEKHDKYGRLIAHLFTRKGEHINALLLKNGLAFVTLHPPNLKYADILLQAQKQAEEKGLGLWSHRYFAPKQYTEISGKFNKGWHRIRGKIHRFKKTRHNLYLKFSDRFAIKIPAKYQHLFPAAEHYIGQYIEARGWLNKSRHGYQLMIRHPADLLILNKKSAEQIRDDLFSALL
jgi:endonuclease YncB( thermonuclease family)